MLTRAAWERCPGESDFFIGHSLYLRSVFVLQAALNNQIIVVIPCGYAGHLEISSTLSQIEVSGLRPVT